jgi:AraC family transcriptional activator of tynA and feaB
MDQNADFSGIPQLDYEAWRVLIRSLCGQYNPEGVEPDVFTGWAVPVSVCGLTALDISCNAQRVERTHRDVRFDSVDHYFAVFLVAGQSAVIHNDQVVRLDVGDVVFVDGTRPVTYLSHKTGQQWRHLALQLPRQSVVSYLGFEPQGGLCRRSGTSAGRLLFELIRNPGKGEGPSLSPADSYLQLAVYDLVGALFAPSDASPVSRPTDKLFHRMRGVIKERFADPDFGPCEAADGTGISLRYLQKLFLERGTTCSEFIYSLRLEQAAHLLHRRASLGTCQPLSEIAYNCGFRDYAHFARKFRHRFGYAPGVHSTGHGVALAKQ